MTNEEFEKMAVGTVSEIPGPEAGIEGIYDKMAQAGAEGRRKRRKRLFMPIPAAVLVVLLISACVFAASPMDKVGYARYTIPLEMELGYGIRLPSTLVGAKQNGMAQYVYVSEVGIPRLKAYLQPLYVSACVDYDATESVLIEEGYDEERGNYEVHEQSGDIYSVTVGKMDEDGYWYTYFGIDEDTLEYRLPENREDDDSGPGIEYEEYPAVEYEGYTLYVSHSAFMNPETGNQSASVIWLDMDRNLVFHLTDSYDSDWEPDTSRAVAAAKEFIDFLD